MAIAITNLIAPTFNSSGLSSYSTISVTPSPNALLLFTVRQTSPSAPAAPSVSGCGLTWTQASIFTDATNKLQIAMFYAMGPAPTAGALTITFAGSQTQTTCSWILDQVTGVDTTGTNGSNGYVQSVSAEGLTVTSWSITLGAFASPANVTYGAVWISGNDTISVGSGFTQVSRTAGTWSGQSEWENANNTTVGWSWTTSHTALGTAMELRAAASLPTNRTAYGKPRPFAPC